MSHKCNYVGCLSSSFSTCAQATSNFLPDVVSCRGQEFIADFRAEQPIVFGCIDYYTTSCTFDATNGNTERLTYSRALREFAACAETIPQSPGFCHGAVSASSRALLSSAPQHMDL